MTGWENGYTLWVWHSVYSEKWSNHSYNMQTSCTSWMKRWLNIIVTVLLNHWYELHLVRNLIDFTSAYIILTLKLLCTHCGKGQEVYKSTHRMLLVKTHDPSLHFSNFTLIWKKHTFKGEKNFIRPKSNTAIHHVQFQWMLLCNYHLLLGCISSSP